MYIKPQFLKKVRMNNTSESSAPPILRSWGRCKLGNEKC